MSRVRDGVREVATASVWTHVREGSRFFMQEGDVYETLRRLARCLDKEGLDYSLVGGMALVAHGYRRFTEDIDILMRPDTLALFRERLVGHGYRPAFPGASKSFRDAETGVKIEVLTTGEYPGDGKPKSVAFPDPKAVRFEREGLWLIALDRLIELKLASGLSAPHRLKDLADVQDLVLRLKLPRDLAERLDESVRDEYRRLWDAAQSGAEED